MPIWISILKIISISTALNEVIYFKTFSTKELAIICVVNG
jgi:hypothetical protein